MPLSLVVRQEGASSPQERHHKALENFYERFPQAAEALFIDRGNLDQTLSALDNEVR